MDCSGPINGSFSKLTIHCMVNFSICVKALFHYFFVMLPEYSESHLKLFYIWVLSKSHIERIVAEEAQAGKNPLDTSEPAVLGWEVLEAEETITEKEAKSSLSAKEEEASGLVNTIVGVFHKG